MNQKYVIQNRKKLVVMILLFIVVAILYMTIGVKFGNQRQFDFSMKIRTPKLIAMMITAFAIGSAAIVFQSIINNTIVTPLFIGDGRIIHNDSYHSGICSGLRKHSGSEFKCLFPH